MNSNSNMNKKFFEYCQIYNEQTDSFMQTSLNFLSNHQIVAKQKTDIILKSASIMLNSEKVAKVSELNLKEQAIISENKMKKKLNADYDKIKSLYESLTNISLTHKNKGNKEYFEGEYYANNRKNDRKIVKFQINKKKKPNNIEKWVIEKNTDGVGEKSLEIQDFYAECLQSFFI